MKKINYYKKAFQNFGIFIMLTVILVIFLMSCYSSFYSSVKQSAIESYDDSIRKEIKAMENEIGLQMNVLKNVSAGQDFKILSNPQAYGYNINSPEWFESRENVQKSFSVLKSIVTMQKKSFMVLRNSDIQIDDSGAVDDFRASYDTLWRLSVDGGNCAPDAAMIHLFYKRHNGGFDGNFSYNDITNGEKYELIYIFTVSSIEEEVTDSVFFACYDAEEFIERLGFNDSSDSVLLSTGEDKKIFAFGSEYDIGAYDSCCESENFNLKVHYSIPQDYLQRKMQPARTFLIVVILILILFGFFATLGLSFVEKNRIKKLVSLTDGITDIEFSQCDDHFKYLETIFQSLYNKNVHTSNIVKDLIFSKLLAFRLTEDEAQMVSEYFSSPVCIVLLKNTVSKQQNLEYSVNAFLKEKNIELIHTSNLSTTELLFFVKMGGTVKEYLEDMIVNINKEHHADIRVIAAVCDDISNIPAIYDRMRKTIQYTEYGSLKFIGAYEENPDNKNFKEIISKSRQLYEIIRSGNEFEAKRIVYEQWYKITQGEISSSTIEPLFFSQTSILTQISSENKLNIAVPRFDSEKDAVSIAFDITECIEQICEKMKGSIKKEDVRSSQIIDYIEQRYCDSSFYMPELVGKFELSDRAIVQMLKKATGDNFSNYLSKLRIARAEELLTTTNIPISEVASASGFDSSNSLYKAFKKVYGVSPSIYRENRKCDSE